MALSRRQVLVAAAGVLARPVPARGQTPSPGAALAALERRAGGRLGVAILDTAAGRVVGHRQDERFAMCSTFKLPLAAVVLREADAGRLRLDERLTFTKADMLSYAPVTRTHLAEGGMTVAALTEATQQTSDNVAANLLLKRLGGPAAFTALLRALGDDTSRLDRFEPDLNLVLPGDPRDTTTPLAMARLVGRCVAGDALSAASRERLAGWMVATATGMKRIRAGLPQDWRAGDKTGTGLADAMTDKVNDIAVTWPPNRAPLVITAYFDSSRRSAETRAEDEATLAEVGRIAAASLTL